MSPNGATRFLPGDVRSPVKKGLWLRGIARVDGERGPGNVATPVAQQELDTASDVDRIRHAFHGTAPRDLLALRLVQLVSPLRGDEAGCDGVHRDAELPDLAGERASEADHRRLGGAVDRESTVAGGGDDRGDVDYPAVTPRHHRSHDVFRQQNGRDGIELNQSLDILIAHVAEQAAGAQARVIDETVDRTEV